MENKNNFGKKTALALLLVLLLLFLGITSYSRKHAKEITLTEMSVIQNGPQTQLILGFNGKPNFHTMYADNPPHLIIDIPNCLSVANKFKKPMLSGTMITHIHSDEIDKNIGLQIKVDLNQKVNFVEQISAAAQNNRLTINLNPAIDLNAKQVPPIDTLSKLTTTKPTTALKSPSLDKTTGNIKSLNSNKINGLNSTRSRLKSKNQKQTILEKGIDSYSADQKETEDANWLSSKINNGNNILDNNKSFSLNSNDLGWIMPLTLGAQYSEIFGTMLHGQLTHSLGLENAVAFLFDAGSKEYRLNGTLAHAFTEHQRLKLSAEYLGEKNNYIFVSGPVDKWVSQAAAGLTYEYLFPGHFLKDINLNTFYSKAQNKDLGEVLFYDPTSPSGLSINGRRIAGGEDKSGSLGMDFLPTKTTLFGAALNYDDVRYDMHYEITPQNPDPSSSGFGGTLTLEQLLGKYFKVKLSGSKRKIYDNYQAELNWLLKNNADHRFEISLLLQHLINDNADQSVGFSKTTDNRIGLNFTYQFGTGKSTKNNGYTLDDNNSQGDLVNWANDPAVHMEKVLTAKDEYIKHVSLPTLADFEADCVLGVPCNLDITSNFDFAAASLISILNKLLAASVFSPDQNLQDYGLSLNLLNAGHNVILSGTPTKETVTETDPNKTVPIPVVFTNSLGVPGSGVFHLKVSTNNNNQIEIPEEDFRLGAPLLKKPGAIDLTPYIHVGNSIKKADQPSKTNDDQLLTSYGLALTLDHGHVYLNGTPTLATLGKINIPIEITNSVGAVTAGSFVLKISPADKIITTFNVTTHYGENEAKQIAQIYTGGDRSFRIVNQDTIATEIYPYKLEVSKPDSDYMVNVTISGAYISPLPQSSQPIIKPIKIEVNSDTIKAPISDTVNLTIDVPPIIGDTSDVIIDHGKSGTVIAPVPVDCGNDPNDANSKCTLNVSGMPENSGLVVSFDDPNNPKNIIFSGKANRADGLPHEVTLSVNNGSITGPESTKSFDITINPVDPSFAANPIDVDFGNNLAATALISNIDTGNGMPFDPQKDKVTITKTDGYHDTDYYIPHFISQFDGNNSIIVSSDVPAGVTETHQGDNLDNPVGSIPFSVTVNINGKSFTKPFNLTVKPVAPSVTNCTLEVSCGDAVNGIHIPYGNFPYSVCDFKSGAKQLKIVGNDNTMTHFIDDGFPSKGMKQVCDQWDEHNQCIHWHQEEVKPAAKNLEVNSGLGPMDFYLKAAYYEYCGYINSHHQTIFAVYPQKIHVVNSGGVAADIDATIKVGPDDNPY